MKSKEANPKEYLTGAFNRLLDYASSETKKAENLEEAYTEYCGFKKYRDWFKYRSSVDLLQDADYAILEVFNYQLGSGGHSRNLPDTYLKLSVVLINYLVQFWGSISKSARLGFRTSADFRKLAKNLKWEKAK